MYSVTMVAKSFAQLNPATFSPAATIRLTLLRVTTMMIACLSILAALAAAISVYYLFNNWTAPLLVFILCSVLMFFVNARNRARYAGAIGRDLSALVSLVVLKNDADMAIKTYEAIASIRGISSHEGETRLWKAEIDSISAMLRRKGYDIFDEYGRARSPVGRGNEWQYMAHVWETLNRSSMIRAIMVDALLGVDRQRHYGECRTCVTCADDDTFMDGLRRFISGTTKMLAATGAQISAR